MFWAARFQDLKVARKFRSQEASQLRGPSLALRMIAVVSAECLVTSSSPEVGLSLQGAGKCQSSPRWQGSHSWALLDLALASLIGSSSSFGQAI